MFSDSKNNEQHYEAPVEAATAKVDPYENIKNSYFKEIDGQKLIMNIANDFKASNAFMVFEGGVMWSVAYIGNVLEFLNSTIQHINTSPNLNPTMTNWLKGKLPVNSNPQIEIGPDKIIDYAMQVLQKYPTDEYKKYIEELGYFKILYDNSEIKQNLRSK